MHGIRGMRENTKLRGLRGFRAITKFQDELYIYLYRPGHPVFKTNVNPCFAMTVTMVTLNYLHCISKSTKRNIE